MIDSHCHLNCLKNGEHLSGVKTYLDEAAEHGVEGFLCVSIDLETYPSVLALAHHFPNVYASVGVHPNHDEGREPSEKELIEFAEDKRVIAIGETGLDYFHLKGDPSFQQQRFITHINAARHCDKPLIIHTRDAREDTIDLMQKFDAADAGGVMHCFTETWGMAQQALDMDFYISFSGIITFKSAEDLREVVKQVPMDRILIETDSPYLAPVPHRGKQNQPAYVRYVAECVAELKQVSVENIIQQTTENFNRLFKLDA
ncbi:MAG: TatD family hydrolase [Gammaproteobacteria bacterium]|nr:TatD family hydrolase [Gammaproteobacteria bacterium]